ncbi:MAG: glycosyltransferase family 2 protein [Thermoplasmatales archaeon]|jgi:Glycosyltransferases involved in cell wall biogenesis
MISIVIPALNEAESIGHVIDEVKRNFPGSEIIIVDSDSTDGTPEIAKSKGAKVINQSIRGYGYAYMKGFENVNGDIIVTLDADGTYPPSEARRLVELIGKYDFINGERLSNSTKEAMPTMHMIGNFILTLLTRILFMVKITDSQSGMWVFKREILEDILPSSGGMEFSEEIKIRAASAYCYIEIPIQYKRRMGEKKLRPWRDGIRNMIFLFKLRIKGNIKMKNRKCG